MIGWLDCRAGVSGDMLLGALVGAGVPLAVLQQEVDRLALGIALTQEPVTRAGLAATKVDVRVDGAEPERPLGTVVSAGPASGTRADSPQRTEEHGRTWADVRALLEASLPDPALPLRVFAALAEAEAAVHGTHPDDVHFHEVGALDALADVVGACAGFRHLALERLTCSPVALGSGTARTAHGALPVPVPAVLELLRGAPAQAGPAAFESTTPTGAALLTTLVTDWGELPPMTVLRSGSGAGGHDPDGHPNVTRLVLGEAATGTGAAVVLETNVDDLDPRLWPHVLERLMAEGASDAWLTPILMKKGRPAHTLSVLCRPQQAERLRAVVLTETTAIGLRESTVTKHALVRTTESATVEGHEVRIKTAWDGDRVVNRQPEWEDVKRVAKATGRPAKELLQTSVKNASAPTPPASGTPTTS